MGSGAITLKSTPHSCVPAEHGALWRARAREGLIVLGGTPVELSKCTRRTSKVKMLSGHYTVSQLSIGLGDF